MSNVESMCIDVFPGEIPRLLRGTYQTTIFHDRESVEPPADAVHIRLRIGGLKDSDCGELLARRIQENLRVLARTALARSAESRKRPKLTARAIREMVRVELAHLSMRSD